MINEGEILKELKKISKIMILSNGKLLETEIAKYASTNDRKKIWVLIDGKRQANDIAQVIGISKRGVDMFLKVLEDASLLERAFNKPPTRIVDYVPAEWVELAQIEPKSSEKVQQQAETSTEDANQTQTEVGTHG